LTISNLKKCYPDQYIHMRFLIIRLSSIGDIVLTTPVIRCIKKQVLGAELHFLVKRNYSAILLSNPYIDKVHIWHDDIAGTIKELRREEFDVVVDLHHNVNSLKIKSALGAKTFSFNKLNVEKWLMTALKWNRLPDMHIVARSLDTVSSFGVINDGAGLDFFIPPEDEMDPVNISSILNRGYVGLVIGAAHFTKKLPLHKLLELVNGMNNPVLLLGAKEDHETGVTIAAAGSGIVINACGMFNLNQSASLVKQARIIITHDTGLMHIAAAFKKPMVSIWGNTIPGFGMYAYYGNVPGRDFRSEVAPLYCRPCSKIGYKHCPKNHFRCMEDQDLQQVIQQVNQAML
jgi:ADP-heptose:LPS heptosyltransferase